MWFIPKEKDGEIAPHTPFVEGGALHCAVEDLSHAQCVPLFAGGCTFHDGYTLHFSKGNSTSDSQQRALILNLDR